MLMWLLYRFGCMPGTLGNLPFVNSAMEDRGGVFSAITVTALLLVVTAAYTRTGWFFVYPLNTRLPTVLGFWIGSYEIGMSAKVAPGKVLPQVGALLIGILPFFLYTLFIGDIEFAIDAFGKRLPIMFGPFLYAGGQLLIALSTWF
jgi:hypothetical protein